MKQCPNGHSVGDNVKFCPECGAKIIDGGAKYCAKCGNERKGTEKFCSQCGTPYGQSPTNNISTPEVSQGKSSRKGILIVAVIAVIALIGGAAWYFISNQQDRYSLEGLAKAAVNFDDISNFHEGLAFFEKDKKLGIINKKGDIVLEPTYECEYAIDEFYFSEGLALIQNNGKWGFIDKKGKKIIPCAYDRAFHFKEGLASVEKGGKFGYINKRGKTVIPFEYDHAEPFDNGVSIIQKGKKYGFINKKGNVIKMFDSGILRELSEGMAIYENEDGKYGFVDVTGKLVIPCKYFAFRFNYGKFEDGYACVYKDEEEAFSVIDKSGSGILQIKCDYMEYSEGLLRVVDDGMVSYYDINGKNVIPNKFDRGGLFNEGLAPIKKGNLYGFIDKTGKFVISPMYDDAGCFSEGLAVVNKDGIYGFVDKNGNSTFDIQDETVKRAIQTKIQQREEARKEEEIKLITEWYDYVLGKKEISDDIIDKFLSPDVKNRIWEEDYEGAYSYWHFRTAASDYDPYVGDISKIEDISLNSDGWYVVRYMDRGWKGETTIKIEYNEIVDFVPDESYRRFIHDSDYEEESQPNSSSSQNDLEYSSTNTSSTSRTFYSEQIVIGYLANQTFRASDGLTMRVDGDGRLYFDGDYAGVLSVLRYNSTSALLRYGGGMYNEGKLKVQIVGDKFQLEDPIDGTVYYQR